MKEAALWSLITLSVIIPSTLFSQSKYNTEKKGTYSYYNNSDYLGTKKPQYEAFGKNGKALSDFFYQNIPLMRGMMGFDLSVTLFGWGEEDYLTIAHNYGMPGELRFDFQLFSTDEKGNTGKWTVEPPIWSISINNTQFGHGGLLDDRAEQPLISQLFLVFPLVSELAPGVSYYDCEERSCGSIVIYNPDRPPYWLPVTTREVVNATLEQWKNDQMFLDYVKPLIAKMTEAELNAPACYGSDDGVLKVNGKGEGLQMMRFNPDYWDRTLPISDIQFLTINFNEYGLYNKNKEEQDVSEREFLENNQHINYYQEVNKLLPLKELPSLISKHK